MLRTRNQVVVTARSSGAERRHALTLVVYVREQDLEHFNGAARAATDDEEAKSSSGSSVNYMEHVLALLDSDTDFDAVVRELDTTRAPTDTTTARSKNAAAGAATMKTISSPLAHVQWRVNDESHRAVPSVLEATQRQRSECFARAKAPGTNDEKRSSSASAASEDVYVGGMFAPMPVRKVAVEMWLYPPHVGIPASGDRIPANSSCVTDFFLGES